MSNETKLHIGDLVYDFRVDRTLPPRTIVVSSYSILDDLTRDPVGDLAKAVRLPRKTVEAYEKARTAPAEAKRRRRRREYRSSGKPRYNRTEGRVTSEAIQAAFAKKGVTLNDVELDVIGRYYGFNGHRAVSAGRIARVYSTSSRTIHKVRGHALQKLGLPSALSLTTEEVNYGMLRRRYSLRRPAGANGSGQVVAGKVDPRAETDPLDPHHRRSTP